MIFSKLKQSFFILILTLCVILSSGYALSTVNINYFYMELFVAYIMMFRIILYFKNEHFNFLKYCFLSLSLMVIIPFVIHGAENLIVYSSYFFKIVIAFGIVITFRFLDFSLYFRKIMLFVSIISLFGYYVLNVSKLSFMLYLPEFINLNDVTYKGAYLFFYIPWIPERNMGIFWEPGLFATFLIFSLLFEIFLNEDKKSSFRILIYSITIITTNSSAGYLLLFIILIMWTIKFLTDKSIELRKYFSFFILIFFVVILTNYQKIIYSLNLEENKTFSKLVGSNLAEQTRVSAPQHNIDMFLKNPVFGNSVKFITENINYVADTSTSTFALSIFGIFGIQYSILWIYGSFKKRSIFTSNVFSIRILGLLIFLIIINKEPHLGLLFSWCVMFYLIKPNDLKLKLNERNINE